MDPKVMDRDEEVDKVDHPIQYFGEGVNGMSIRQTKKGCVQQCFGCEAPDEFKWFDITDGKNDQFATSLEESDCCPRVCCTQCHEFTMVVKESGTEEEVLAMHRPCACPQGPCKCCCSFQQMDFSMGGEKIGQIKEGYYYCVPRYTINDAEGNPVYKVHSPTCCNGCCVNICSEGNPCFGKGCCKLAFHIFPYTQDETDNGAPYAGKIVKVPKSMAVEFFTDANAFNVHFPEDATAEQKAMIAGSSVLINANFFEAGSED